MSLSLQCFYEAVRMFLLKSELETEQSLLGYSDEEIALAEQYWSLTFPESYRLFLKHFGKANESFNYQDWGLETLPFAKELSREIAERNKLNLDEWFPFTERQWYSFHSFKRGPAATENPEVMLVVEGDQGVEVYNYPSFTDWLMVKLENHLNLLISLHKPDANIQLELFEALKLML
ncbi:SMI1/KNR4 family protein [Hymenobacter negativus]|uniref:SMI1/KNR4 family protein n=1 Tax=Hymenobacter negativus TaxID=2795026 RepID=A0ABS3Q8X6_9BACT|nr:SMI1/KNR4 family protein [Hymenobacter negativus]MBO2007699.1 SMI1/KNR4 family protein [Hymenobacter negativus]